MANGLARSLHNFTMSERLLCSAFLILMGLGYVTALGYLYFTHRDLDGKPGLSVEDIVFSYYGNRSGTRMEQMLRGPMQPYSKPLETALLVAWLQTGASQQGYDAVARPILQEQCFGCHSGSAAKALNVPDFSTYEGVGQVTEVNKGESLLSLIKLSHIHLFGIGLILFGVGLVFRHALLNRWVKWTLIVLPFVAIFADILAWFLTKWDPIYAYVVVVGGGLMGLAFAAQIVISLYQMWFLGPPVAE